MRNILRFLLLLPIVAYATPGISQIYCYPNMPTCDEYQRTSLINNVIDLRSGESRTIALPRGWRHVKKVYIFAKSYYSDSTLQVSVNGDEKGRFYVPRTDPYYVANVDETTASVTLSNLGSSNFNSNGVLHISSLSADLAPMRQDPLPRPTFPTIEFPVRNEAASLARQAVALVDALRPYADPETEYIQFLLPIKRIAGRTLALANARGNGSGKVRESLEALAQQIHFADDYISTTLKKEASFELAVELLSLKDKILDWLN